MASPPHNFLLSLLLFILIISAATPAIACRRCSRARAFLEASCRSTQYPQLCVETLMSSMSRRAPAHYHSPQELAQMGLKASLARARRAQVYMTHMAVKLGEVKGQDYQAMRGCLDQIDSSMSQISQSIQELRRIKNNGSVDDFTWHSGNVMTWTSSALTDQSTCLDAFPGGRRGRGIPVALKIQVTEAARVTSNALALVNRFIMTHRLTHEGFAKKP